MGLPEYGNAHIIHARCTKVGNSSILDHNNLIIKRQRIYFNSLRQLLLLVPHKSFLFKLLCVNVMVPLSCIQAIFLLALVLGHWTLNSLGSLLPLTTNPHAGTDTDSGMIYSEEPEQSN